MNINVPYMNDIYVSVGYPRRNVERNTNLHRYKVEIFCTIIDMQLQELNSRFNDVNTELLLCVACLSPIDAFSSFDKRKLLRLVEFYPIEFSSIEIDLLDNQLKSYIIDMTSHQGFLNLSGLTDLATRMAIGLRKLKSLIEKKDQLQKDLMESGVVQVMFHVSAGTAENSDFAAFRACEEALGVDPHPPPLVGGIDGGTLPKPECTEPTMVVLHRGSAEA
ncbi:zinc finger MYM-type protein 1-like [Canna indica]|uniref:Zinc finger MYM-type protein 1-like n=1 Tax=Canna indica TaxID=4628 RepID=A0AAQ3JSY4_9LILI|nr:zinc finger MYM-type protein 1-like [Canna indica]